MRIASYYGDVQSVGRNDGNATYLTNVIRTHYSHIHFEHIAPWSDTRQYGAFDLNFMADWGEDALGLSDFTIPSPFAYWASDTHIDAAGYKYRLERARQSDFPFVAQKKAQELFSKEGVKATWLPHAFEPSVYQPGVWDGKKWLKAAPKKRYDIGFVGHLQDQKNHLGFSRIDALDRGYKHSKDIMWKRAFFEDAASVYNESKIILNCTIGDDIPMRWFEVMGCKGFLLTNSVPSGSDLFKPGVHYATFGSLKEMDEKIDYYLDHPEEREKIAEAGYKEVQAKHTFKHRLDKIFEVSGVMDKVMEKSNVAA